MASKAKKSSTKSAPAAPSSPEAQSAPEAKPSAKAKAAPKAKPAPKAKAAPEAKPAPKAKAATPSTKGKRYSNEEKAEILQFVEEFNAKNGRGGQTAAASKYGISQLTIMAWRKVGGGVGRKSIVKASGSSLAAKLASLSKLHGQIVGAEKELQSLKAKFDALRASL